MKIADLLSQVRFYLDEVSPELLEGAVTNQFWTDAQLCLLINQSYAAFRGFSYLSSESMENIHI